MQFLYSVLPIPESGPSKGPGRVCGASILREGLSPAPDGERMKLTAAERPFAIYDRLTAKNAHAGDSRRCIVSNVENMALQTRPMFA